MENIDIEKIALELYPPRIDAYMEGVIDWNLNIRKAYIESHKQKKEPVKKYTDDDIAYIRKVEFFIKLFVLKNHTFGLGNGLLIVIGKRPSVNSSFDISTGLYFILFKSSSLSFIKNGAPIAICNALEPIILAFSYLV